MSSFSPQSLIRPEYARTTLGLTFRHSPPTLLLKLATPRPILHSQSQLVGTGVSAWIEREYKAYIASILVLEAGPVEPTKGSSVFSFNFLKFFT